MTRFSSHAESDSAEWWEVQHSYPDSDGIVYRGWSSTNVGEFGKAAVELLHEAVKNDAFAGGFVSDHRFRSEAEASRFLIEFARVAVCHKSMSFRVAHVVASITVEEVLEVTPPKICGKYGYYGPGDHRREDRYCQKAPGHNGGHGPKKARKAA